MTDPDLTYIDMMNTVGDLECRGIDPYTLCVALELSKAVDDVKKQLRRSKASLKRLSDDIGSLFDLSVETYKSSFGASTPAESVSGVVEGYLESGMDIDEARAKVKCPDFMARIAEALSRRMEEMKGGDAPFRKDQKENLTSGFGHGIIFPFNQIRGRKQ